MIACHCPTMYRRRSSLFRCTYTVTATATPLTTEPFVRRAFVSPTLRKLANTRETPVRSPHSKMPVNEDLYRFTSARFVFNLDFEKSQRYARYDVDQLALLVAAAVIDFHIFIRKDGARFG